MCLIPSANLAVPLALKCKLLKPHLFAFLGLTLRCSSHTWIWLKFRTSSESGISGPACSLLLWPGSIFKDNSLSPFWVRNGNSASVQVEGRHWRIFHRTECYLVGKLPCEPAQNIQACITNCRIASPFWEFHSKS